MFLLRASEDGEDADGVARARERFFKSGELGRLTEGGVCCICFEKGLRGYYISPFLPQRKKRIEKKNQRATATTAAWEGETTNSAKTTNWN